MGLLSDLFGNKLIKLKIIALKESGEKAGKKYIEDSSNEFEVMFNPETYSLKYVTEYKDKDGINAGGKEPNNFVSRPTKLDLDLVIDGTGVSGIEIDSVRKEVDKFLKLTTFVDGEKHRPNPVQVTWGEFTYQGTLASVDIKYPLFDRTAEPLRAELKVQFAGAVLDSVRVKNLKSPDLTRFRMVTSSDNLPLMTAAAYEDPALYISIAQVNRLNNFRKLQTGASLRFPPIKEQ